MNALDDIAAPPVAEVVRAYLAQIVEDVGLSEVLPEDELEAAIDGIGLGLGQLLADVERALRRRGSVPLHVAVHDHEGFPYLSRFHGSLRDAFMMEVPAEMIPIIRRILGRPPPEWATETRDTLSIVARSSAASRGERAFATLMLFEGVCINLWMSAYRTNGQWEGVGGCGRDVDAVAWATVESLLGTPLGANDEDLTFAAIVVAAMEHLCAFASHLGEAQLLIRELAVTCEARAAAELAFREADPIDAAVLRNYFDRAHHQQPIPMSRLPREHPLVLQGFNENSINKRTERALDKLEHRRPAPRPVTLAKLIVDAEVATDA